MADEDTEVDMNYDTFVGHATEFNQHDAERASSAGEDRQAIKKLLDETGVHPKAFSFCRMVLKQKKFSIQTDIIRSMKEVLPHVEAYVYGNGTQDMFKEEGDDGAEDGDVVPFDEDAA